MDASAAEDASQEPRAQTSLEACVAIAVQRGAVGALRDDTDSKPEGAGSVETSPRSEGAVDLGGFNLHASVAIAGDDDMGREKLMRYGARPPLALDRLRRLPDGRIAYRIKKLRGSFTTSACRTSIAKILPSTFRPLDPNEPRAASGGVTR